MCFDYCTCACHQNANANIDGKDLQMMTKSQRTHHLRYESCTVNELTMLFYHVAGNQLQFLLDETIKLLLQCVTTIRCMFNQIDANHATEKHALIQYDQTIIQLLWQHLS